MRSLVVAVALAASCAGVSSAQAFDESKYPDWAGEWRLGPPTKWDPSKPPGRGQEAPLTPEYQAVFEANLADQAAGGQGPRSRSGGIRRWRGAFPAGAPTDRDLSPEFR